MDNKLNNEKNIIPKYHYDIIKDQSKEFIDLTIEYYNQKKNIEASKKRLRDEKGILNQLDSKIQKICKHDWEMDTPQYQTPTSYTCKLCGAYK